MRWNRTEPAPISYYWFLFGNVITIFIVQASFDESSFTRLLGVSLQSLALLVALQLRPAPRKIQLFAVVVVVAAVGSALFGLLSEGDTRIITAAMPSGLLAMGAVAGVLGAVKQEASISGRTILCAITVYVFIGLTFAYLYRSIQAANDEAFHAASGELDGAAFQYFSFITLTTVGFGDITAVARLPRAITAFEALIGQVYLVTVVALVVGNLGRERLLRPRAKPDGQAAGEE